MNVLLVRIYLSNTLLTKKIYHTESYDFFLVISHGTVVVVVIKIYYRKPKRNQEIDWKFRNYI